MADIGFGAAYGLQVCDKFLKVFGDGKARRYALLLRRNDAHALALFVFNELGEFGIGNLLVGGSKANGVFDPFTVQLDTGIVALADDRFTASLAAALEYVCDHENYSGYGLPRVKHERMFTPSLFVLQPPQIILDLVHEEFRASANLDGMWEFTRGNQPVNSAF
ncbi:MAG: hypothetical protein ABQ298_02485 [Puniceicoccaceae bacterium]